MKNNLFVWALIALIALAAAGCVTTKTVGENQGNFGEHTRTPVKDFASLGLVFTETQLTTSSSGTSQGQIFTYQALLKEAQKLGADAIINVVIDKKTQNTGNTIQETWYGSALAIKYTNALTQTTTVTVTAGGTNTQTTAVYFNDGGNANSGGQNTDVPAGADSPPRIPKGIRQ